MDVGVPYADVEVEVVAAVAGGFGLRCVGLMRVAGGCGVCGKREACEQRDQGGDEGESLHSVPGGRVGRCDLRCAISKHEGSVD